ncbi:upstream activation factor subunit UAF30 [Vigna unguiculata]|uniref:upstream activation factor subunit UAF30 n=1 Tax=Vigna unguiculata TaxID=3917 RepID=UPI001016D863|nr:upstream activation factor subunit UAF30 [Vigna unguiculata]
MAVAMSLCFGLLSSSVLPPEAHALSFTRPSRSASASPSGLRMVRTVTSCTVSHSEQGTRKIRGIMKPRTVTPEMAALVGALEISRTQALKRIWAYIKDNNLQDPADKRTIICDEKLKKIFEGRDRVGMLDVARLISPHFLKTEV